MKIIAKQDTVLEELLKQMNEQLLREQKGTFAPDIYAESKLDTEKR